MGTLSKYNKEKAPELIDIPCCICGGQAKPYAVDYNGNSIARCPKCSLRFVSPRPVFSAFLEHVYEPGYYADEIPRSETDRDNAVYLESIKKFKRPPGLLLDVGASAGYFLESARAQGWDIEGLEIQPEQVKLLRKKLNCPIKEGLIDDMKSEPRFDLLTVIHVLEHTADPKAFLAKCLSLVKPGGVAYLVFPNTHSLNDRLKSRMSSLRLKPKPWKHLAADHHLWFFSAENVRNLCAAIDAPILSLRTVFPRKKKANALAGLCRGGLEKMGLGSWIELILKKTA